MNTCSSAPGTLQFCKVKGFDTSSRGSQHLIPKQIPLKDFKDSIGFVGVLKFALILQCIGVINLQENIYT